MTGVTQVMSSIIQRLKAGSLMPTEIDMSRVGNQAIVSVYNLKSSHVISESITTGMDNNTAVATTKALTEWIERHAYLSGYKNNLRSCQTERSDGFAAFPTGFDNAKELARENALCEAIERYTWAKWWDDQKTKYTIAELDLFDAQYWGESYSIVEMIKSSLDIERIVEINPKFSPYDNKELIILVAEIKDHGVITGGACGDRIVRANTLARASGELLRHVLAAKKILDRKATPASFYEKRLDYLFSSDGRRQFYDRISCHGQNPIILPELIIDEDIPHVFDDVVCVHRCLFKDQPPFVGGPLERMCL